MSFHYQYPHKKSLRYEHYLWNEGRTEKFEGKMEHKIKHFHVENGHAIKEVK